MIIFLYKYKAYIHGVYTFFILLHFVIKDYLFPLSILFYATPLILIIVLGLFITIFYYKQKRVFIPSTLVLILLSFQFYLSQFNVLKTKANLAKIDSVLFWNIAKNEKVFPKFI
ncbi:MAG: hypothetical protein QNK89_05320 [Lacinutrix sp.]|uniref:hypothetical protein n=1 Tax=Lacinutrix sp. TaxID=1937692 RepID=UPI0030B5E81B